MSNSHHDQVIKAVELAWQDNMPLSKRHEDYYFSLKSGLEETRYVYLTQNKLPQRWVQQINERTTPFTIVETGFGTGLNFLTAWQAWQKLPEPKLAFNFISIEKYPLTREDLTRSLNNWPELKDLSQALIQQYPYLVSGSHLLSFDQGKVKLKLIFGDVNTDFEQHTFKADCWFLDGFSPSKNPSMWTDTLFNLMSRTAHNQTTFSSFSAAGVVRKGLSKAGFEVSKTKGFGGKRDMTYGTYNNSAKPSSDESTLPKWSTPAPDRVVEQTSKIKQTNYDAIIIGAGLAGITTAASLAEKGLNVALLDQKGSPVSGASGQSQLALYVKLPTEINKTSDFISHCTYFSQRYFEEKQSKHIDQKFWNKTGLLQLAWNDKEKIRHQKFMQNEYYPSKFVRPVTTSEAKTLSGLNISCSGLWFENSGWLEPCAFASASLKHPLITIFTHTKINSIQWCDDEEQWTAISENNPKLNKLNNPSRFQAKHLIIANSNDAKYFDQAEHIPSKPLKGQVSSIYSTSLQSAKAVICGEGYLCPSTNNWHHFGATFDLSNSDEKTYTADNVKNMLSIRKWLPSWLPDAIDASKLEKEEKLTANAGLRCTTPDYMPIVGRAPIYKAMLQQFSGLRKDAKSCKDIYGEYYPNLYMNIGHGSKGLVTTPIAAELISALITGSPNPFNSSQLTTIAPARFIIRRLKQGKI